MIESKYRPTVADVSLVHIVDNLKRVMEHLPEGTEAWAVVKANAYGHGAVAVAKTLTPHVAGFCLSNLDEALELRRAGIKKPLLVLGVVPVEAVNIALAENIQLTVTSQEWVDDLLLLDLDLSSLDFHIKVDSGMGRLGFRNSRAVNQAVLSLQVKRANFAGIFTHFATADEVEQEQFEQQLNIFKSILTDLKQKPERIHASNSATAIWHAETVFDAVRLGDVLYGFNPSGHVLDLPYPVKPALTLKSALVQVKELEIGATVGYGATYRTSEQEWIGTVPIGYADGLTRSMQGFKVLVDGTYCEIVGRVSMDQITIRLPKAYPLGTEVVLIGDSGDMTITAQDWADHVSTINYEVVCLLSDRIPRTYSHGDNSGN